MRKPLQKPDKDWMQDRARLSIIEGMEDPVTIALLMQIGVTAEWRCLEVGAGGGSIAAWLCQRVGRKGHVTATDIDTRFLKNFDFPNLEVLEHDISKDLIEIEDFDVVHARNLLIHLPKREDALQRMANAVRPGGWILIEEPDLVTEGPDPTISEAHRTLYEEVVGKIYAYLEELGMDLNCGGKVFGILQSLGFEALQAEGRTQMFQGGPDTITPHRLAYAQLEEPIVASGLVPRKRFEDFLSLYADPSFAWREGLKMAVWGRCPEL